MAAPCPGATKVHRLPEVKSPNAISLSEAAQRWDEFLGKGATNINPVTGEIEPNRIFSADGTKSIRFGGHEMDSIGTRNAHYHEEKWSYDLLCNTMTVSNYLQRIIFTRTRR